MAWCAIRGMAVPDGRECGGGLLAPSGRESQEPPPDLPDERVHEGLERRISLFQLVNRLPELQRRVIEMRFVEDKSVRDVAATLDRTEGAVKQLQLRALENLRKGMGLHD